MSRLLSVIRLSDLSDESTSPDRQRGKNQQYADLGDHKIIGEALDLDVSGAVNPFRRLPLAALWPMTSGRAPNAHCWCP